MVFYLRAIIIYIFGGLVLLYPGTAFKLLLPDTHPYVGEPIIARFTLSSDHPIGDIDLFKPDFPGWWAKPLAQNSISAHRHQISWIYRLSPQKSGSLKLPTQKISLKHMDPRTYAITRTVLSTRARIITIEPLPAGIKIAGDFVIKDSFEQNSTSPDTPAYLDITITGTGDIDDLPALDPNISDALVLAGTPQRIYSLKDSTLKATFKQHFTIVADHSITIPPVIIPYLNTHTKVPQLLQTNPHRLNIKPTVSSIANRWSKMLAAVLGVVGGFAMALLWITYLRSEHHKDAFGKPGKIPKNDRDLYAAILPYASDPQIQPFIRQLESNIYRGNKHKIDRRMLIKILAQIKSSNG